MALLTRIYFNAVFGALGGLLGWMLFGVFGDTDRRRGRPKAWPSGSTCSSAGPSSAAPSATSSSASRPSATARCSASSAWPPTASSWGRSAAPSAWSSANGSISALISALRGRHHRWRFLGAMFARGLGWMFLGVAVGVSEGVAARSLGKLSYGTARRGARRLRRRRLLRRRLPDDARPRGRRLALGRRRPGHPGGLHRLAVGPGPGRLPAGLGQGDARLAGGPRISPGKGRQPPRPRRARRHRPIPRHEGREAARPDRPRGRRLRPREQPGAGRSGPASTTSRWPAAGRCRTATASSWATSSCASRCAPPKRGVRGQGPGVREDPLGRPASPRRFGPDP